MCYPVTCEVPLQCGEKIRDFESESTDPVSTQGLEAMGMRKEAVSSLEASGEWARDHTYKKDAFGRVVVAHTFNNPALGR